MSNFFLFYHLKYEDLQLFFLIYDVNEKFLGFGLLVGHKKQFEDVTLQCFPHVCFTWSFLPGI